MEKDDRELVIEYRVLVAGSIERWLEERETHSGRAHQFTTAFCSTSLNARRSNCRFRPRESD